MTGLGEKGKGGDLCGDRIAEIAFGRCEGFQKGGFCAKAERRGQGAEWTAIENRYLRVGSFRRLGFAVRFLGSNGRERELRIKRPRTYVSFTRIAAT